MALRILAFILLNSFLCISSFASENDEQFVLGVGDKIVVEVYNESDLTTRARIDKSGVIKFPLIGHISVVNKTPKELTRELENAFFDGYLVAPLVSVLVEEYRPFFIRGEVRLPGIYAYTLGLTVDQAIAVAGGLKDRASRSKWHVIRGEDKRKIKVKAEAKILPGDIINIDSSIF